MIEVHQCRKHLKIEGCSLFYHLIDLIIILPVSIIVFQKKGKEWSQAN